MKTVEELQIGDRIQTETGDLVRVTRVEQGFWSGSLLIEWGHRNNQWACVDSKSQIEVEK